MKLRYIRAFIVLLAGLIALILNMKAHRNINVSLLIVIGVIIFFYLISTLLLEILDRSFGDKSDKVVVVSEEANEENNEVMEDSYEIPFDEE